MNNTVQVVSDEEIKANITGYHFLIIMCAITALVWLANEVGIFIVNPLYMRIGMTLSFLGSLPGIIMFKITKGNSKKFKYLLISSVSLTCIAVEIFLTYHAVLICMTPVLLSIQYADWKLCKRAFAVNHIGILVAVIAGYFFGCWDGNMRYATTFGITMEADSIVERFHTMNLFYLVELIGYFALPRMFIFSALYFIIKYVVEAAKNRFLKEIASRERAEHDSLTGLENREKYNSRLVNEYTKLKSVMIVFIDVNFLKKINDVCGHEAGDAVLKNAASIMNELIGQRIHGYRLGGDEFALVLCDYTKEEATQIIDEWYQNVKPLNRKEDPIHCSFAIGMAYGENVENFEDLMKEADDAMYENKKAMKAMRTE